MDHISRISIFLEVVKHESFAKAARKLGMTGPAISKQVQALENNLGVKLLRRTTRQVTLTEEGAIYVTYASKAIEDLQEAENQINELRQCPIGNLKISAPMSFGKNYLIKPIAAFAKEYSNINMEVDFDDRKVDIIAERYDVAIRIGNLPDSSLIARKLAPCPIILCASRGYIAKYGQINSPQQLENFPGIIFSKHGNNREWNFKDKNGNLGNAYFKKNFAANNAEMMLEACLLGLGMALLPIFAAADYLKSGRLQQILPDYSTHPETGIYAIFPENKFMPTKTRLFVDWILEYSKELPW